MTDNRETLLAKIDQNNAEVTKAKLILISGVPEPERVRLKDLIALLNCHGLELREKLAAVGY